MADSLAPACTPLKQEYDSCFNLWFEGYLEPTLANATETSRKAHYARKAEEFEAKCGKVYKEYQACLQGAVKERGIEPMLQQAREEHPLKEAPPLLPKEKK
ncbi:hypothetical protein HMN09_01019900 [Mycena chlorophos]|uniref:Mitochondrial distribution and morphology protein 35 n=1 Tax=Mycena chlorophos TaxID=658473 RepID=A0A8H6SFV0_MYCCL|nr:hypothetical protein HMN09_01019900 [Mycena chlorophos]